MQPAPCPDWTSLLLTVLQRKHIFFLKIEKKKKRAELTGISVSLKTQVRETNVRDEPVLCSATEKYQQVSRRFPGGRGQNLAWVWKRKVRILAALRRQEVTVYSGRSKSSWESTSGLTSLPSFGLHACLSSCVKPTLNLGASSPLGDSRASVISYFVEADNRNPWGHRCRRPNSVYSRTTV